MATYENLRQHGPTYGPMVKNGSGATVPRGRAVKLKAVAQQEYDLATADTDVLLGVSDAPEAGIPNGAWQPPITGGVVRAEAADEVVAGDPVRATTDGKFTPSASTEFYHGQAVTSVSAADIAAGKPFFELLIQRGGPLP